MSNLQNYYIHLIKIVRGIKFPQIFQNLKRKLKRV
jgi:hypothetical protein